ncbi:MAG: hypothetical protein Q9211_003928, partial [Gyalolechia sp. 1 TL-2023]
IYTFPESRDGAFSNTHGKAKETDPGALDGKKLFSVRPVIEMVEFSTDFVSQTFEQNASLQSSIPNHVSVTAPTEPLSPGLVAYAKARLEARISDLLRR